MDRNGFFRFPEGSRRQVKVERYCCNVSVGATTTVNVKGLRSDEMHVLNLVISLFNRFQHFQIKIWIVLRLLTAI